jgi:hypothetical protein
MLSENKSTFKTLENKKISIIFGCDWIIYRKKSSYSLREEFLFPLFDILNFVDLYTPFLENHIL